MPFHGCWCLLEVRRVQALAWYTSRTWLLDSRTWSPEHSRVTGRLRGGLMLSLILRCGEGVDICRPYCARWHSSFRSLPQFRVPLDAQLSSA